MHDFDDYWCKPIENLAIIIQVDKEIAEFTLIKYISKLNRNYNHLAHFLF
ncbi:hypothetical protein JCM16418A_07670 [Paenibacillus pini]